MPSKDFAIRIYGERLTVETRKELGVMGCLMLYVAARADAQSHTVYLTLEEFAVWAACSYGAARQAWDKLELLGVVTDVRRRSHGVMGTLGEMFQKADAEVTVAVKVYERVFRRRPHSTEREVIGAAVGNDAGDLKLWRGVCETWKGNPADSTAMIEAFDRKRKVAKVLTGSQRPMVHGAKPDGLRE